MIDKPKEKRQKKKSEVALQISEDRLQLLDTIHEIVNVELDNRGVTAEGNPHLENPPPRTSGSGPVRKPSRRLSLCQCIKKNLFRLA